MTRTVVVVNDSGNVNGGAAQVALSSAAALARLGHRTILLAATGPVDPQLKEAGVETVLTDQFAIADDPRPTRAAVQGLWNRRAAAAMRTILGTCDSSSTIVHVHGWVMALSSSVIREAVTRGFRVVVTLHDYFIACPNGGFYNFPKQRICELTALSIPCILSNCDARSYGQKLWRVARQIVQRGPGRTPAGVDAFITVSRFSERILAPYLPAKARIFRVGNPFDVSQRPAVEIRRDAPFIYVGRLTAHKGVLLLAEVSRTLRIPILFVGDGPLRSEIQRVVPEAKVTGWLGRDAVHAWLRRARAVVLPSLWYETQGLVVAEAAAFGVPAVVADTSAARDMVRHGENGLCFTGGCHESLAQCMVTMSDVDQARRMGAAAYRDFWRTGTSLEQHAAQLDDCYREVLAEPTIRSVNASERT